jgi:hypothetical protein
MRGMVDRRRPFTALFLFSGIHGIVDDAYLKEKADRSWPPCQAAIAGLLQNRRIAF